LKNISDEFYPVAMTIAGSDSGGGAGIQADLRTFSAAGIYGCSVITAVTAQNPRQVSGCEVMPPDLIKAQYNAIVSSMAVRAAKTGMLGNGAAVRILIRCLENKSFPLIVDPVMIASSGAKLLDAEGMEIVKNEFLHLADMVTPNLPEAEWLLGRKLRDQNDYVQGASELAERYKCGVLLKTGHAPGPSDLIADVAVIDNKTMLLTSPRVTDLEEYAAHGTGCTLSSAITAMLARGEKWRDALLGAKSFVYGSLCEVAHVGKKLDCMYPPLDDYSGQVGLKNLTPGKKNVSGTRRQK